MSLFSSWNRLCSSGKAIFSRWTHLFLHRNYLCSSGDEIF